jgi:hypothetical protein
MGAASYHNHWTYSFFFGRAWDFVIFYFVADLFRRFRDINSARFNTLGLTTTHGTTPTNQRLHDTNYQVYYRAGLTTSLELTNNLPLSQLGNDTTNHHHDQSHQSPYKLTLQPPLPVIANVLCNDETLGSTTALDLASSSLGINDHEHDHPHFYHHYNNPRFLRHYTTLWQIADVDHFHGLSNSPMTIAGSLSSKLSTCGCDQHCGSANGFNTLTELHLRLGQMIMNHWDEGGICEQA